MRTILVVLLLVSLAARAAAADEPALRVGSKRFTESFILGEIVTQTARLAGAQAIHEPGLGNTAILVQALEAGSIDVYPEYTGTIAREILGADANLTLAQINEQLRARGLAASVALGFSDTYAIGLRRAYAERHGIRRISELARVPDLRLGFSHEFLGRRDGWPGLKAAYALPQASPRGLDHGLAYEALAAGEVDAIDLYSTDAKIARYDIMVLDDDRGYFPRYDAVLLHGIEVPRAIRRPGRRSRGSRGRIDAPTMIRLNGEAELGQPGLRVDRGRLRRRRSARRAAGAGPGGALFAPDFGRLLGEHVALVVASLIAAIAWPFPWASSRRARGPSRSRCWWRWA